MDIQKLKKVIQEANPEKYVIKPKHNFGVGTAIIFRLADVLLAMKSKKNRVFNDQISLIVGGIKSSKWNLADNNLDNQSDELKRLLNKLLVKDNE